MGAVNHPEHYNKIPGIECIDVVENFNFNVGNAIKYLWRAGEKTEDPREDLEKALWYCQREINRLAETTGISNAHANALLYLLRFAGPSILSMASKRMIEGKHYLIGLGLIDDDNGVLSITPKGVKYVDEHNITLESVLLDFDIK